MSTIITTAPTPTGCMPWCSTDDPLNHHLIDDPREPDDGEWFHSRRIATGAEVSEGGFLGQTYSLGQTYAVTLEYDGTTRLIVELDVNTLTADQAEVLARALLEGVAALRASGDTVAQENTVMGYWDGNGWVKPPNRVLEPTPAEREAARSAR